LRNSFTGEGEETQQGTATERSQLLLPLADALAEKEKQLAQRETEIALEKKRLEDEQGRFEQIRREVEGLLKQMEQQVDSLDAVEEERLSELAKTYAGMRPEGAAKILQKMSVDDAVRILMRTPTRNRARIVENMENASDISAAIISALGD
jgi:flagellar motility protein MotE (MotC chaperone)